MRLLAGQVYQEGAIVPTRLMNLWFTRKTIFVEVGGPLLEDNGACARIAKYFVPGRFRSILSQRGCVQPWYASIARHWFVARNR